mmetsp:Transcript_90869/g.231244  ORF Transcript_90869/g.231244 Transcript_90869/m.231244 type:complete len:411 (+) Transcript_90869:41-1273(+)
MAPRAPASGSAALYAGEGAADPVLPVRCQRTLLVATLAAAAASGLGSAKSSSDCTVPSMRLRGMVEHAGRQARLGCGQARAEAHSSSGGMGASAGVSLVAAAGAAAVGRVIGGATASHTRLVVRGASSSSWAGSTVFERKAAALEFLEAQRMSLPQAELPPRPSPMEAVAARGLGAAAVAEVVGAAAVAEPLGAIAAGSAEAAFSRIYDGGEWLCGSEAKSGLGSRYETTREFCEFLQGFLREHSITSVVDAGCGHWPSGYQRYINWQGVHYHGVDVVQSVVQDNAGFLRDADRLQTAGLASATFSQGDVSAPLPAADLLLVKDVLMHLPNAAVQEFLRNNVDMAFGRYRMVLLVQNSVPKTVNLRQMIDIEPGQLLPFDITAPPFNARFVDLFRWQSDEPKAVQLWTPA